MHRARVFLGSVSIFAFLAACVGGPGPLPDQGGDQGGQGRGSSGGPSSGDDSDDGDVSTAPPPAPVMVSASSFDRSCEEDDDCVGVFEGFACTSCQCPNAAINKKDRGKHTSELSKGAKDCEQTDIACGECAARPATCDATTKTCALGQADEG